MIEHDIVSSDRHSWLALKIYESTQSYSQDRLSSTVRVDAAISVLYRCRRPFTHGTHDVRDDKRASFRKRSETFESSECTSAQRREVSRADMRAYALAPSPPLGCPKRARR